jgi:mannose/cellobiose epimerase-like protein (N-acyl-D-glucosamine 2-epimerase family)
MKSRGRVVLVAALLAVGAAAGRGQGPVRSPYLLYPERAIPYVDSCASFWFGVYDSVNGGFSNGVDRTGKTIAGWGTNKGVVVQSRDAYGFTRAYMLTGNETYLVYARRALDFLYAHLWDNTYGGWFSATNVAGIPLAPTGTKTAFDQHYALLGPAAYVEATQDSVDWAWLRRGYAALDQAWWDSRPGQSGYYDNVTYNGATRSGKSFNATVDAITTHVLALYLLTGEDEFKTRLQQLGRDILQRIAPTMDQQVIGFVESYGSDWTWNNNTANNNTRTIMGHVLKTAWCLGRIQQLLPDSAYLPAAEKLTGNVLAKGYDHAFGGPYKDYDRVTGQMLFYGQDTAKAWWQMEQAVTGGLMLYNLTGKSEYLVMADRSLDFFMAYFVDHQYGEVYADRFRNGGPIDAWGTTKGNEGKAAYHSVETGYYVYLYGKLLLRGEPATLHYRFVPVARDRMLRMNPLAITTGKYRIKSVFRNDTPYGDFDAGGRTLHVPAGMGGHFTVTYEPVLTAVADNRDMTPAVFRLGQNYPNPFNPTTTIQYELPRDHLVTVRVYDLLGREVASLVDGVQTAGTHTVTWNAAGLASGVYLYRLTAGGSSVTRTSIVLK